MNSAPKVTSAPEEHPDIAQEADISLHSEDGVEFLDESCFCKFFFVFLSLIFVISQKTFVNF